MFVHPRTSLAVKLPTLIVISAGLIFILMILFNYFFLKNTYIAQAGETAKLLSQIGGLAVATFITLLLVPVFYSIFVLDLKIVTWEPREKPKL